jgi:hypothetical protein
MEGKNLRTGKKSLQHSVPNYKMFLIFQWRDYKTDHTGFRKTLYTNVPIEKTSYGAGANVLFN